MGKALRLESGEKASYRSKTQHKAMQSILHDNQTTPLVVILLTRGGKSLLFIAPACLENAGVTIVVVPFRALINKLVETVRQASINSIEWRLGQTDLVTLVFISADKIIGGGFLSYAELLKGKGLLRRVFVNKCHLTFTASD
jgi:superfamily II DNA or RNA helicase